jgi:hypothetical protein
MPEGDYLVNLGIVLGLFFLVLDIFIHYREGNWRKMFRCSVGLVSLVFVVVGSILKWNNGL